MQLKITYQIKNKMAEEEKTNEQLSDEDAIMKIAAAMKDNAPTLEEKNNVHTFLRDVVVSKDPTRVGNLRDDKELNELGLPQWNVRGSLDMKRISDKIMNNDFFKDFFESVAFDTLATSLSRQGFLVRQASLQTKQIVDATKRRKTNKGMFGSKKIEESGGDITTQNN